MTETQLRLVICLTLIIVLCSIRSFRTGSFLRNNHFIEIAWSVAGVVLTTGLLVQAYLNPDLVDIVGPDGVIALMVGAGTQVISSLNDEIRSDFVFLWGKFTKKQSS